MSTTGVAEGIRGAIEEADASNVLLLGSPLEAANAEACTDLLTIAEPRHENVLCLSFTQSPDERVRQWRTHVDADPGSFVVVHAGSTTRSAAGRARADQPFEITVETVTDPGDLTGMGIAITRYLDRWIGTERRVVFCFHTLTSLLQYADLTRGYRFLHVLTSHMNRVGAVAHYHLDPSAHEDRVTNTLKTLFDAVIELDADGTPRVRTRTG